MELKFKKIVPIYLMGSILLLSACTSDEEKKALSYKQDKKILITYDEDLAKPIIQKEKSPDEVIEDMVKKQLDYNTPTSYKSKGISDNTMSGITQKLIKDEKEIPNTPALSKKDIAYLNKDEDAIQDEEYKKKMVEKFNSLKISNTAKTDEEIRKEEEKALKEQYEKDLEEAQNNVGKSVNKETPYDND